MSEAIERQEPESRDLLAPQSPAGSTWSHSFGRGLVALPSLALVGGVRLYQIFLGPFFGGRCRFHPSCSHYFIQAVRKYGALSGAARGVWRILRCHPWCAGGDDPP